MGTDIHLFTEVREQGSWRLARIESQCSWCDGKGEYPTGPTRQVEPCYRCKGSGKELGYSSRNYDVFAILADVRNGSGFAGVATGDGFNIIAPQRGLPTDMDRELRELTAGYSDEYYEAMRAKWGRGSLGDHSFSWLTLRELLEFDWTQVTRHRGIVSLKEYRRWRGTTDRTPKEWSGGIWGQGTEILSEGNPRVTDAPLSDKLYVEAFWTETYAECAGCFHSRFIPALVALGHSPDDVRIVFGFDS